MEQTINEIADFKTASLTDAEEAVNTGYRAFRILRVVFTIIPIIAGIDKFFHFLVDWDKYLPPFINRMTGGYGQAWMLAAGVIEVIAGVGVWLKPKIFAYVVAAWLFLIIVNLLIISNYDIALRDLGLALGALVLGQLSQEFSKRATEGLFNKFSSRGTK